MSTPRSPSEQRHTTPLRRGVTRMRAYGHTSEVHNNPMPIVRLNAQSFYKDEDFLTWLNHPHTYTATWHTKNQPPTEMSDVFLFYGGARWHEEEFTGEGSDYPTVHGVPGVPTPIYQHIAEAVAEATGSLETECLIWITNM